MSAAADWSADRWRNHAAVSGLACESHMNAAAVFVAACEWEDAAARFTEAARSAANAAHWLDLADQLDQQEHP